MKCLKGIVGVVVIIQRGEVPWVVNCFSLMFFSYFSFFFFSFRHFQQNKSSLYVSYVFFFFIYSFVFLFGHK